jgi:hypothetical protein
MLNKKRTVVSITAAIAIFATGILIGRLRPSSIERKVQLPSHNLGGPYPITLAFDVDLPPVMIGVNNVQKT